MEEILKDINDLRQLIKEHQSIDFEYPPSNVDYHNLDHSVFHSNDQPELSTFYENSNYNEATIEFNPLPDGSSRYTIYDEPISRRSAVQSPAKK